MEYNGDMIELLRMSGHILYNQITDEKYKEKYMLLSSLSVIETACIIKLAEKPDIPLKDLAECLKISKSTLTSIISRLENKNLILREIKLTDKRAFLFKLTKDGKSVLCEHEEYEKEICRQIIKLYDNDDEKKQIRRLLNKLIENYTRKQV